VDPDLFRFNEQKRKELRKKLGFRENQLIGIYVGKFGGLYLEIDQLRFLKEINTYFKNTGFIILSPDAERLHQQIIMLIDEAPRIIIDQVPHDAVPDYLSASDFAISLNKSFKSGKYLSPIKIGEYWANGLPVLLTEGIGDESQYIENERGGALFDISNIQLALGKLREIINDPDHRMKIPDLAKKYRSFEHVRLAYTSIIVKK
jgi:glycosyltransferase involved in cell wall biosynthesis